jgi:hypothetical protein
VGYKITCSTDGRFLKLLYISPASKHDLSIIKERYKDFIDRFRGHIVLLDKGYVDENFTKFMRAQGVGYIAIKRRNMIKDEKERKVYRVLRRIRRIIETRFSQLEEFGLRFIRAVSRRGLAIKIVLSILAFNIYQLMGGKI